MNDDTRTPAGDDALLRIDTRDAGAIARWARKLDATPEQIRDAVAAVGDKAADVEMHLKGSRSTTNAEQEARGERIDAAR